MKNFKIVLNAKINTNIYTLYSIVKVNGFTYIFIPKPLILFWARGGE